MRLDFVLAVHMTLHIPISDIVLDPRHPVDISPLPPDEVIRLVNESMGFLADKVSVTMAGGIVSITLIEPESTAKEDAEKLLHDGIAIAKTGNYKQAIEKFQKSLKVFPTQTVARRNLAMALLELGKHAEDRKSVV